MYDAEEFAHAERVPRRRSLDADPHSQRGAAAAEAAKAASDASEAAVTVDLINVR